MSSSGELLLSFEDLERLPKIDVLAIYKLVPDVESRARMIFNGLVEGRSAQWSGSETRSDDKKGEFEKRGMLMCHGAYYTQRGMDTIPQFLPKDIEWKTSNFRSDFSPDYVANIHRIDSLLKMGKFAYILDQYCPIHANISILFDYLYNCRQILIAGGYCIFLSDCFTLPLHKDYLIERKEDYEGLRNLLTSMIMGYCGYSKHYLAREGSMTYSIFQA